MCMHVYVCVYVYVYLNSSTRKFRRKFRCDFCYVFRRELAGLFWGRRASESLFAITLAQESFLPSGETAVAFLDSFFRKALEMDDCDCDCTRDEPSRHRLSRLVFSNFRVLETPRDSSRTQAHASLSSRSVHPTTYRLALSQRSVFPCSKKVSSTRQENIFETAKSPSRTGDTETMTGLLCNIGHVWCLSKLSAEHLTQALWWK